MNNGKKERILNLRKCISCGERRKKDDLIRIVRCTDDSIKFDATGKTDGRGAYVCRDEKCILRAFKEKRFERALKKGIPQDIKENLERDLRQGGLLDGDHQ